MVSGNRLFTAECSLCPVPHKTNGVPVHIHTEVVIRCSEMSRSVCSEEDAFHHIYGSTGLISQSSLISPSSSKSCCFSALCEQLACFGHSYHHVVLTTPSCSRKAKTCFCHQMDKKVVRN